MCSKRISVNVQNGAVITTNPSKDPFCPSAVTVSTSSPRQQLIYFRSVQLPLVGNVMGIGSYILWSLRVWHLLHGMMSLRLVHVV